jgi:multicomponent K+:H+ antiporter subunit G
MIQTALELLASLLLVTGAGFTLVGAIGLVRLPDFFTRLHGPTKATTLGVGAILLGSMTYFAASGTLSVHELLVACFLFLTAPVSAHMLGRAALHRRRHQDGDADAADADGGAAQVED